MHPAHEHVTASQKRRKAMVEGRARGGKIDRPGKNGLTGGASEASGSQSTARPPEPHEEEGQPPNKMKGGGRADGGATWKDKISRQGVDPRDQMNTDFRAPGTTDWNEIDDKGRASNARHANDETGAKSGGGIAVKPKSMAT